VFRAEESFVDNLSSCGVVIGHIPQSPMALFTGNRARLHETQSGVSTPVQMPFRKIRVGHDNVMLRVTTNGSDLLQTEPVNRRQGRVVCRLSLELFNPSRSLDD